MKRLALLSLLVSASMLGQDSGSGLPPLPTDIDHAIATTVDFEGTITLGVSDLVSSVVPALMPFGWMLLFFFGAFALLQTQKDIMLRAMSSSYYHPLSGVVAYVAILFRMVVATLMLTFYTIPMPGMGINFHQIFPYLSQALSNAVTTDLLKQTLKYFSYAVNYLPPVGILQVMPALITVLLLIVISLAQVGMTFITAGSSVVVGVFVCCGMILIPFYVLPGHDKKFWSWLDNLLAYSMYSFVGACFIYVFCHAYIDFFSNLHGFGVGQWLVSLPMLILITVVFLWAMFKVPEITHMLFGGIGAVGQSFANSLQSLAVIGVTKLLK